MLTLVLFVVGLVFVLKGADLLVDGASSIAKILKISELVIGLTVVAFGTSAPELAVNIFASISGNQQIAISNILGSNICNVLLILGVASVIYPLSIKRSTIRYEIPLSLLAAVAVGACVHEGFITHSGFSGLSRIHGCIFLTFFLIFMIYTFVTARSGYEDKASSKQYSISVACGLTLLGLAGLTIGGKWTVDGAVYLANLCGVNEGIIGLTVVAIGTSLPELATSAVAAYKKNSDIAIGNIIGSNIFNIFLILGTSAVIAPLPFMSSSNLDILLGIFIIILLWVFVFRKGILARWHGVVFLILYFSYMAFRVFIDKSL